MSHDSSTSIVVGWSLVRARVQSLIGENNLVQAPLYCTRQLFMSVRVILIQILIPTPTPSRDYARLLFSSRICIVIYLLTTSTTAVINCCCRHYHHLHSCCWRYRCLNLSTVIRQASGTVSEVKRGVRCRHHCSHTHLNALSGVRREQWG